MTHSHKMLNSLYCVLLLPLFWVAFPLWSHEVPTEIPIFSFNVGTAGDTGKIITKNIQDIEKSLAKDKDKYARLMNFIKENFKLNTNETTFSGVLKAIEEKNVKSESDILKKIWDTYADSDEIRALVRKFPQQGFLFFGTIASQEEQQQFMERIEKYRTARLKVLIDNISTQYPSAIFLFQELFSKNLESSSLTLLNAKDEHSDVAIAYSQKHYRVDVKKKDQDGAFLLAEFKSLSDDALPTFGVATIHAAGCDPNTPQQYGGGETDADAGNESFRKLLTATKEMKNVILVGDLNVTKKHPRFELPASFGFREAVKAKQVGSDTAYTLKLDGTHQIDHAFYKTNFPGFIQSLWANTIVAPLYSDQETKLAGLDEIEGKKTSVPYANPYGLSLDLNYSPSDHRPIFVVFKLNRQ